MGRVVLVLGLVMSLAANGWFAWRERTAAKEKAAAERRRELPRATPASPKEIEAEETAVVAAPRTAAELRALEARLARAGVPPDVARVVVMFSLHREFDRRRKELAGVANVMEYWRNPVHRDDLGTQSAIRELEREQRQLIRTLGMDNFNFDDDGERRQFGSLAPEKVARLKKIFADYGDLEEQLFADGADRNAPENRARAELLAREKRADLERALTPQELLEYDYRNSQAGHRLRGKFGPFRATEAEFVAAFPAIRAIVEEAGLDRPIRSGNMAEMRRAREAAERRIDDVLRQSLGETRYAEMKEANDHTLRQTREFAARLNLAPHVAAEVVAVQSEFAPKLSAVDRDRDLTPNQRDAKASELAIEARERLIRAMGAENFEAYKRKGGGWLGAALNRRAPTPSPAPAGR